MTGDSRQTEQEVGVVVVLGSAGHEDMYQDMDAGEVGWDQI